PSPHTIDTHSIDWGRIAMHPCPSPADRPSRRPLHAIVAVLAALGLSGGSAGAVTVPDGFVVENAVPGGGFVIPTKIAFLPGGRMLVAEKGGAVWTVTHGIMHPTPLWDGSQEVLNEG